jgi:WXXGXW repeat (2 copies)
MLAFSAASFGQVFVSVRVGPPALPIYAQPLCPGPGYFWTPGYWGWNDDGGYYWVPGTWVVAPVGMLWTPGYWGWGGGFYAWHGGYWGPHIGFYGGINYGFGYGGVGFFGGEWRGGAFYYNRSVTNVTVTNVTNVYNRTVIENNTTVSRTSFNGGEGGIKATPTPQEQVAEHETHTAPLAAQTQHETAASQNKANFASENHGRPAIAATARPGDFSSRSAVSAKAAGAEYHSPAMSPREARGPSTPTAAGAKGAATSNTNNGFRPFTPPAKGSSGSPAAKPAASSGNGGSRVSESRPQSASRSEPHAAPQSKPSASAHSAPPKKSPPPPKKQNEPKEGHRGKGQ